MTRLNVCSILGAVSKGAQGFCEHEGEAQPEGTRASPMAASTSSCVCEATQSPMTCRECSDEADQAEGSLGDVKQQQLVQPVLKHARTHLC